MKTKNKLICGVGTNDFNEKITDNGKIIKSYETWFSMIHRCYDSNVHKQYPTYIGCSVCPEWLSFSNFKTWFDANYIPNFQLDKDILIKGNKEYGPDACRFVPSYLNNLLLNRGRSRGPYPLGVCKNGSGYLMQCSDGEGKIIKRHHKTIEAAQADYSITKSTIVKKQVLRAFEHDGIKSDVCTSLLERVW